ncbi:MAG: HNH endonuclease [Pseudanabaena sp.]|nr:MAG: HNH endonuclease [Pseudanabaena sp.]
MRPIFRGNQPLDLSGKPKGFKDYHNARGDLIDRIGEYCSYCETRLGSSLDIEHILPQALFPDEEQNWENFCLACTNCNSIKKWAMEKRWNDSWSHLHQVSAKIAARSEFFWIDRDNTFSCLEYTKGGFIQVNTSLSTEEKQIAQSTIKMVGLDRTPNPDPQVKDRRWNNRRQAWDKAERSLENLSKCNTDESREAMRDQIISHAVDKGFWSVWMTVFKDDPDMLQRFIDAFAGTCLDCFDISGNPIPRQKGRL